MIRLLQLDSGFFFKNKNGHWFPESRKGAYAIKIFSIWQVKWRNLSNEWFALISKNYLISPSLGEKSKSMSKRKYCQSIQC